MLSNYKLILLNYLIMMVLILGLTTLQNTVYFSFFGLSTFPIYFWIPCLIYWALYRKIGESTFMLYFITLSVATSSSLHLGLLIIFNSLLMLSLFLFKRIYYTSWVFFSIACATTLFLFPILLWILARILEGKYYFHNILPWILGGMLTWLLSFVLLNLFQRIDKLTLTTGKENKKLLRAL